MSETSYCTWRDYPDSSLREMHRKPVAIPVTQLKHIPVGSLFIELRDAEVNSHPPVVCIKTEGDGKGFASFKFGLNRDYSIIISDDTLVIPLCGDYNG